MLLKCLNGKRANVSGMSACLPSAAVRPARGTRGRALALRPRVATGLPFRGAGGHEPARSLSFLPPATEAFESTGEDMSGIGGSSWNFRRDGRHEEA